MKYRNCLIGCCSVLLLASALVLAQPARGKSELKTPNGSIILDYGRPSLQGRDMLSKLVVGNYWRLGKDEVTVLSTPLHLVFGSTKVPKGTHGLWLKRQEPNVFELVFNGQATGHAMVHDASKDVASIRMVRSILDTPIETLTMDLLQAPNGGSLVVQWGTSKLKADFQFSK